MSVTYVTGNLLDFTQWSVAAHCANCLNTFGAGIARQIKERYPAAFDADTEAFNEAKEHHESMLGTFSVGNVGDGRRIVNVYGQYAYDRAARQLNYEAFYSALEKLKKQLEIAHSEGRVYSLGLPYKIGSNLAGGDWQVVEAMIRSLFEESPISVYIVKLP